MFWSVNYHRYSNSNSGILYKPVHVSHVLQKGLSVYVDSAGREQPVYKLSINRPFLSAFTVTGSYKFYLQRTNCLCVYISK